MRAIIAYIIILFYVFFTVTPSHAAMREVPFVSVMADASLVVPFTQLARIYSATYGITVNVTYDSSLELASQIEKGEPTDVFISASPFAIVMLKRKELVDIRTLAPIAQNKLALIAAADSTLAKKISPDASLWKQITTASNHTMLVIGDPDTTALGAYSRQMLQNLGLWEKIYPLAVKADNSGMALYLIAQGKSAGIAYYSDTVTSKEVKLLALLPQKLYSPVIYKAIALEGKGKPFATQFIDFLTSPRAKEIFKRAGFEEG